MQIHTSSARRKCFSAGENPQIYN